MYKTLKGEIIEVSNTYETNEGKCQNVKVYINESDDEQVKKALFASSFKIDYRPFNADYYLQEGINLIEGININVIFTPGHSRGGVTFIIENNMMHQRVDFYMYNNWFRFIKKHKCNDSLDKKVCEA